MAAPGDDFLKGGGGRTSCSENSAPIPSPAVAGGTPSCSSRPADGIDAITDFTSGSDRLEISAAGFGGGLVAGAAAPLVHLADIHGYVDAGNKGVFLFDNAGEDSGTIYFDANGGSSADAIAFVRIDGTSLLESDFRIA